MPRENAVCSVAGPTRTYCGRTRVTRSIPPYVTGKGNPSNPSAAQVPRSDPVVGICGTVSIPKRGNLCLEHIGIHEDCSNNI